MDSQEDVLSIDIEKVINKKSSKGKVGIPKFIIHFLKRIIHQDEINELLKNNHQYTGVEFATHILQDLEVTYNVHYSTPLDASKRYIFVSNHPLGGLDGLILISYIGNQMNDVRFVVNDLLMNITPLKPIFIPINKYGKMKHDYAELINQAFESDTQILYFPAGLCSRLIKGEIKDLDWKKTFVTKAIESHRDIIPIYFHGRNSMFFYRLAKLRKWLHISFNIETIFLPAEMFKQKKSTFDLYIGEPVPYQSLSDEHTHKEWTEIIRKKCYGTYHQTH